MKKFLIGLILLLIASQVDARNLEGVVKDAETGKAIRNVNVQIQGLNKGDATDKRGRFKITKLESGIYIVRASRIGYAPIEKRMAIGRKNARLNFRLKMVLLPGDAVTATATRGVERETPIAFSNITRKELKARYTLQDMPDLLSELPSINTYNETGNGIGYSYITMRGFDQRRIAVMINGIPQNDPEDHNVYWVNFPDLASSLEDIQVQRGAGSAFYGPAAIGGSINLVTDRFDPTPKLTISSGYGSYDTRRLGVTLNSGLLNDKLALNATFSKTQTDGYRDKAWVDFQSYFFGGAYYTKRTTTRFHIYGSLNRDHLNYYGIPKDSAILETTNALDNREYRKTNPITGDDEIEDFHQPHYELLHEWTVSPNLTVQNGLFYVQGGGFFDFDGSWADTTYFRLTAANGFTPTSNPGQSLIRAFVNNRQGGWLPRISYRTDRSTTEAGMELRYHQSIHWGKIRWAENLPAEVTPDFRYYEYKGSKWIVSAYANHNYRVTDKLNLMSNLQIAHKRYRLFDEKYLGTEFTVPHTFVNPQLGANFNVTKRVNLYASFAHTEREPRLKNYYDAAESTWSTPQFERQPNTGAFDFDKPLAKAEKLNNVELGGGYTAPRLRANINLFWMDFRDEIVKNGQLDLYGQPVTGNADKTLHQGVEISGAAFLAKHFTLQGNLSLSKNTFKRHTVFEGGQAVSYNGNRIAGFPDLLANVRATYVNREFTGSLNLRYVGKQYTDNSEDNRQNPALRNVPGYIPLYVDPYTVLNLSLAYDLGKALDIKGLEIRLDINNLFDTLYETHGEGTSFFPAATRNFLLFTRLSL